MIEIKKAAFNKGDFQFSIDYIDGADFKKLETNEEALASMDLAKVHLESAVKSWLQLPDCYSVKCNCVRFGRDEEKASAVQITAFTKGKEMNIVTSIRPIAKNDMFPDKDHVNSVDAIMELRGELLRYVRGERAQGELPFDATEETVNGFDLFEESADAE